MDSMLQVAGAHRRCDSAAQIRRGSTKVSKGQWSSIFTATLQAQGDNVSRALESIDRDFVPDSFAIDIVNTNNDIILPKKHNLSIIPLMIFLSYFMRPSASAAPPSIMLVT